MGPGGPGDRPARPARLRAVTNVGSMPSGTRPPGRLENFAYGLVPVNVGTHRASRTPLVLTYGSSCVVVTRLWRAAPCHPVGVGVGSGRTGCSASRTAGRSAGSGAGTQAAAAGPRPGR